MNISIRLEEPKDYRTIEEIDREAFWHQSTACNEHLLTHKLRTSRDFIPELDFVAELDGTLAGHIIYSRSKIVIKGGEITDVITFGPLAVLPEFQNRGVGKALLRHSIAEAARRGYRAIVIFGEPDYYPRLGFRRAAEFGITTAEGATFDAFMVYPLYEGALDGVGGVFHLPPVYEELTPEEASEFDGGFPYKEPASLAPIEVLLERLPPGACAIIEGHDLRTLAEFRESSGREVEAWGEFTESDKAIMDAVMSEHGYGRKTWTK
ncbi:MAG: N-acetyltransferase [Oscillospiraceae bacterium]|nr:N-acetyltransferase [Oscillospiraceae bacterium]